MSIKRPRIKVDNLRLFDKITTGDVYYINNSLLLHFNGPNSSANIEDNSKYVHSITANGDAQISTGKYKFGNSSLHLDGTGDYLTFPYHECLDFDNGDFTLEAWVNFSSFNSGGFDSILMSGETVSWQFDYKNSTNELRVYVYYASTNDNVTASWTPSVGTWYHVAAVRNGSDLKLFVDGTQIGSTTNVGSNTLKNSAGEGSVGARNNVGSFDRLFNGYIDEVRITRGVARYTSNFEAPTKEFSDSSGDINKKIVVDEEAKGLGIGEGGVDESRLAHAWITFDGHDPTTSAPKIIDGYNISSIAENGVGDYTIHFNKALLNENSCVIATVEEPNITEISGGTNPRSHPTTQNVQVTVGDHTVSSVGVRVNYGSTINHRFDSKRISVVVFSN